MFIFFLFLFFFFFFSFFFLFFFFFFSFFSFFFFFFLWHHLLSLFGAEVRFYGCLLFLLSSFLHNHQYKHHLQQRQSYTDLSMIPQQHYKQQHLRLFPPKHKFVRTAYFGHFVVDAIQQGMPRHYILSSIRIIIRKRQRW